MLCALLSLLAACNRLSAAIAVFREVEEDERRESLPAINHAGREGGGGGKGEKEEEAAHPTGRKHGGVNQSGVEAPQKSAGRVSQVSGRWVRQEGGAGRRGRHAGAGYKRASESGYQSSPPLRSCIDAAVYNALIVASGRAGRHRLALRLFDEMCDKAGMEGLRLEEGEDSGNGGVDGRRTTEERMEGGAGGDGREDGNMEGEREGGGEWTGKTIAKTKKGGKHRRGGIEGSASTMGATSLGTGEHDVQRIRAVVAAGEVGDSTKGRGGATVRKSSSAGDAGITGDLSSSEAAMGFSSPSPHLRANRRGSSPACAPNASTFGSLVMALCKAGRTEEAEAVVTAMPRYHCRPSAHIFNSLLAAAGSNADVTVRVLEGMREAGVKGTGASVTAVMGTLLRGGAGREGREGSVLRLWRAVREGRLRGDPCELMAFLPSQSVVMSHGYCGASLLGDHSSGYKSLGDESLGDSHGAEQRQSSGRSQEDTTRNSALLRDDQRLSPRGSKQAVAQGHRERSPLGAACIGIDVKMVTRVLAAMARLRLLEAAEALWAEAEARRDTASTCCQLAPALPGALPGTHLPGSRRNDRTGNAATGVPSGCSKTSVNGWVAGHNGRGGCSCGKQLPAPVAVARAGPMAASMAAEEPSKPGAVASLKPFPVISAPLSPLLDCQGSWGAIDGPAVGAMLAVYVACGRLEEGRRFLQCTREREGVMAVSDSVVCVLLRAYASRGMVREMESLFDWHVGTREEEALPGSQGRGRRGGDGNEAGCKSEAQMTGRCSNGSNSISSSKSMSKARRKCVSKPVYEAVIEGCRVRGDMDRAGYWRGEMQRCGFAASNGRGKRFSR